MSLHHVFVSAIFVTLAAVPLVAQSSQAASEVTMPSGLRIIDTKVGAGPVPQVGQTVTVNYTGWLYVDGKKGKKFDSSLDRGEPFSFTLGEGQVIKGWDEGVATMHVGGKRTLIIPPNLGYGASGAGGVIPPNATLMFDIDLLSVK
jgi:peptidylprolyl isomerase